jgi:hypothetical protein
MSSYVKSTNFASKDSLAIGNPLKIVKGTEIDEEFNNIATAIDTKADLNSPTFIGAPIAPTAGAGTNTTQLATTAFVRNEIMAAVYPVGSIYTNATNSTNPGTLLGFGTWSAFGAGRVAVGFDGSNSLFNAAEKTGGNYDGSLLAHTHGFSGTTAGGGAHTHDMYIHPSLRSSNCCSYVFPYPQTSGGVGYGDVISTVGNHTHTFSGTTASTGTAGTNTNVQPFITVYMWKRTA